jgi:hypothetical protein
MSIQTMVHRRRGRIACGPSREAAPPAPQSVPAGTCKPTTPCSSADHRAVLVERACSDLRGCVPLSSGQRRVIGDPDPWGDWRYSAGIFGLFVAKHTQTSVPEV